jgi:hypothetical protein
VYRPPGVELPAVRVRMVELTVPSAGSFTVDGLKEKLGPFVRAGLINAVVSTLAARPPKPCRLIVAVFPGVPAMIVREV